VRSLDELSALSIKPGMADAALAAMESAETYDELQVAILRALPFNDHAHIDAPSAMPMLGDYNA
jgi:hypothetical protein